MSNEYKPDTLGVRAGGVRSDFQEHSEALALTTSFVYKSAARRDWNIVTVGLVKRE